MSFNQGEGHFVIGMPLSSINALATDSARSLPLNFTHSINKNFPGDVSAMVLCGDLQHSPPVQYTFQACLFSVKPCCCRVASYAHYPGTADTGREGWELWLWKTCYGSRAQLRRVLIRCSF
jgi:hypothetical protein